MKYLLLCCLLITSKLLGQLAVTENEPSALVEGIVSAVTGDLYALEEDIVIQGAEPLRLKRSYISAKGFGQWHFFENLIAEQRPPAYQIFVNEPNGTTLIYTYDIKELKHDKKKKKKSTEFIFHPLDLSSVGQGLTNAGRGALSAHTNLKNQYVQLKDECLSIVCPDGTKRMYHPVPDQKPQKIGPMKLYLLYYYLLEQEELPNGNKIIYNWDRDRLTSIRTTDPSGQKTYAEAHFHYHGKVKKDSQDLPYSENADFDVQTSDGRTLQYAHFCEGKPKDHARWHLRQITSSDSPQEDLHYLNPEGNRPRILSIVALPHSRELHIDYYPPGSNDSRVKTLSSPVGTDVNPLATHKFSYDLSSRKTSVLDSEEIPTHYYWDENLRLISIESFSSPQSFFCNTSFVWGSNNTPDATNLICKVFKNAQHEPLHATRYLYDTRGNVVQEKFYGNLTGKGKALILDSNNLPLENGVEVYTKKYNYSQDGKDLLLCMMEDNGSKVVYEYLPGTNLPILELFYDHDQIKRRKLYEYNTDRILIREVIDDGTTDNTTRLIRKIYPKPDQPYLGMPQIIEERCGVEETLLKKTCLHYTTAGRVCQKDVYDAHDTFCYSLIYKYDEKGRLIEETDAVSRRAVSVYDEVGNKIFFRDFGSAASFTMQYDYSNRLIESKEKGDDDLVRITHHSYNKKHQKIATIDPHGYETRYVYDALGNLIETHLPSIGDQHPVTLSSYDSAGNEISRTDAAGNITQTSYNAYNKPSQVIHPDGAKESWSYYKNGEIETYTDPAGTLTTYTYDALNRILSKEISSEGTLLSQERFAYDGFNLLSKTNAEGVVTIYTYDSAGRKIAEEIAQERTEYAYDMLGRLHATRTGELVTITEHDLLDRVIEERKESLSGEVLSKKGYTYDSAGNLATTTRWIEAQKAVEHYIYDGFNRLLQKIDALGSTTERVYDDTKHEHTEIDPLGLRTIHIYNSHYLLSALEKRTKTGALLIREENIYDLNHHLISKTTILPGRSITTRWEYDSRGRVVILKEPKDKITTYTYTPTGEIYEICKPSGVILTKTHTPLGYLSSQTSSDGTIRYIYEYDRLGNLLKSTDEKTILLRSYDCKGRLLTETLPSGLTLTHRYDLQGRLIQLELPDRSLIHYGYDALHLRTVGHKGYSHSYHRYDLAGNLLSEGVRNPLLYHYDLNGRRTSVQSEQFNQTATYDAVGNIVASCLQNKFLSCTYDSLYQLTSENAHTYSYDALFNRLQKDTVSYTIDALNRLPEEFNYDSDGNPTAQGNTEYAYDALGRLIRATTGTKCVTFAYDSLHRRISKTTQDNKTLFYLYDDQKEIGAVDETGTLLELRVLGRTPQAEIGSAVLLELYGQAYIPIHDLQGNVSLLISDKMQEQYRYSAFGEEEHDTPASRNPWRFSSKRIDEETHLVYFGRRYYMPAYGRWLTPDPLGLEASSNLYAYVFNAPLTHVDLYGLLAKENNWLTRAGAFTLESSRNMIQSPRFQGSMQALGGLAEAGVGGLASFGSGGLAAPIGFPVMAHGFDQFITGMGTAVTGRYRATATEQLLQKSGMSPGWSAFTNNLLSTSAFAGTMNIARNALYARQSVPLATPNIERGRVPGKYTESIVGQKGWELKYPHYQAATRHTSTSIRNQLYSGHALDQMQNRGLLPSVVENTIKNGQMFSTKPGTIGYYDSVNNIRVILNSKTNQVVTVISGAPK